MNIFDGSLFEEEYLKYRESVEKQEKIIFLFILAFSFGVGYLIGVTA